MLAAGCWVVSLKIKTYQPARESASPRAVPRSRSLPRSRLPDSSSCRAPRLSRSPALAVGG
eukprot:scaffold107884_cov29-Tisochrysis_lutea.AAC.3